MTRAFLRLVVLALIGAAVIPFVTVTCSRHTVDAKSLLLLSGLVLMGLAAIRFRAELRGLVTRIDANARDQATFLDALPLRHVDLAIVGAAALSLFLELAVIRWQGTVFEFFAFYKNFS